MLRGGNISWSSSPSPSSLFPVPGKSACRSPSSHFLAFPIRGNLNRRSVGAADSQQYVKGGEIHPCSRQEQSRGGMDDAIKFSRGGKLLSQLSTWRIGGPCNYFVEVFNEDQLVSAVRYCNAHSIKFLVIGNGSNCLFDDSGYEGCIILNRAKFSEKIGYGVYRVGSGYPFNLFGAQCSREGFGGLEFAGGVPGTVGGAAFMNAGSGGQETAETIDSVEIITMDGMLRVLGRSELAFGYRMSSFQKMADLAAIVAVTFRLQHCPSAEKNWRMHLERRRRSQPIRERTAGSVFRNPEGVGVSSGELIERAGLKGCRVGGAKISDLHANFFINYNGSSSKNMLDLIELAKEKVDQKFGIRLEEEVCIVPYHA